MGSKSSADHIAALMAAFRRGDSQAGARLMEAFYPELKRMAASRMRGEREGHSWQPTLLVNELYLQLMKIKELRPKETDQEDDRSAFLVLAGQIMRRLLIHHARPLAAKAEKVPVLDDLLVADRDGLVEVESVLTRLGSVKPILRTIVEMKVFEGRTADEIAKELGCSTVTVHRHWQFARHWLEDEWRPGS